MVRPEVSHQVAPRQNRRPPSETMKEGTPRKAMMKPCKPPMAVPTATPARSVTIQVIGCSKPTSAGRRLAWTIAMVMPVKPSTEPIDRSMLRVTITSTMPVTMTATEAVWTVRFQRLRAVRNLPSRKRLARVPVMTWKAIQMTRSAPSMPIMRVSISVARRKRLTGPSPGRGLTRTGRCEMASDTGCSPFAAVRAVTAARGCVRKAASERVGCAASEAPDDASAGPCQRRCAGLTSSATPARRRMADSARPTA